MSITHNPKISVVVPAYNESAFIKSCITHLRNQTCDFPYEIIVVDNNSSDNTAQKAREEGVIVLEETRKGVANARETGFRYAKGQIIASTDADTRVPATWLENINKRMEDKTVAGVMGTFLFYDRGWIWNTLAKIITPCIMGIDWLLGKGGNHFLGMNFAVRKDIFEKSGGFTKDLQYGEDIDLGKKVKKIGKIIYVKELRVQTHSRRYQPNLAFAKYLINFVKTSATGKPYRNELPQAKKKK